MSMDLSAVSNFAKDIKTAMHELSDVPRERIRKSSSNQQHFRSSFTDYISPVNSAGKPQGHYLWGGIAKINTMILKNFSGKRPKEYTPKKYKKR